MKRVQIGISHIGDIHLRVDGDELRIDDENNDGVIECKFGNLRKTIQIIEDVYKQCNDLDQVVYGYGRHTIQLGFYQDRLGLKVFRANYIIVKHMPTIIKMLKSVKIEKEKFVLNRDSLFDLDISDLTYLKQTMQRRKKVLTDENGCKYIEV